MSVTVCGRPGHFRWFTVNCPTCTFETIAVSSYANSGYWGSMNTCTSCGERWADGEIMPRPFRRGWRQSNIAEATAEFDLACQCPIRIDSDGSGWILPCEHEDS